MGTVTPGGGSGSSKWVTGRCRRRASNAASRSSSGRAQKARSERSISSSASTGFGFTVLLQRRFGGPPPPCLAAPGGVWGTPDGPLPGRAPRLHDVGTLHRPRLLERHDRPAEREEGGAGKPEVGDGKRDADDRDGADDARDHVRQGEPPAEE